MFRRCWYSSSGNYWRFCISSTFIAIKVLKEDTRNPQQKYFNKKFTENVSGMLEGHWRILYKQTECPMYNLKYAIMSCMLQNLYISVNDPCELRWCLEVKELVLIKKKTLFTLKTKERLTSKDLKFPIGYEICKYINI